MLNRSILPRLLALAMLVLGVGIVGAQEAPTAVRIRIAHLAPWHTEIRRSYHLRRAGRSRRAAHCRGFARWRGGAHWQRHAGRWRQLADPHRRW